MLHEFRNVQNEREMFHFFKQAKPEIIHVHYWGLWPWSHHVFKAAKRYGCQIIENINTPITPYVDEKIARYVFVSNYVKDEFGSCTPDPTRNITVYPGSNFELFTAPKHISTGPETIGMVYRLANDKIDMQAIDVFLYVLQKRPQCTALIVGGGPLLKTFQCAAAKANLSDRVIFTGTVSYTELPSLYARMHLFVAPVKQESFGQVTPFAMNMKIPVVAYDTGALPEIINDKDLLAPVGDSRYLAELAIKLLDDPSRRQSIAERNYQRAQALFSLDHMIQVYSDIYMSLVSS